MDKLYVHTQGLTGDPATITITQKHVYGKLLAYPVCDRAKIIAAMVGAKVLRQPVLDAVKALGFTIVKQAPQEGQSK